MNIRWIIALLCVCFAQESIAATPKERKKKTRHAVCKNASLRPAPRDIRYSEPTNLCASILKDVFEIHINLASFDFFRIGAAVFPAYIALRMADERIHGHYYDADHHKNKNQCSFFNHDVAQEAIAIPILALASLSVFSHDEDLRATSRVFTIGMPFVILAKDIIKELRFKAAYRPYSQNFAKQRKHVCGGFPSGHMAEMGYMTVLYSMRHGAKFAVPLTLLSAYVGATFVACNRHYASQIAAGAALGALYAVAASRVIDDKLEERRLKRLNLAFDTMSTGDPALSMNYQF